LPSLVGECSLGTVAAAGSLVCDGLNDKAVCVLGFSAVADLDGLSVGFVGRDSLDSGLSFLFSGILSCCFVTLGLAVFVAPVAA
jgi:hypothetical protein